MIERVAIADIRIGERRRQDLGDIASLAKNIETHGLLHPIIVAADNELIAGERRLRAHEHLGADTILVRRWPDLTDEERHEIELAENINRKDLTPFEAARDFLAEAAAKAEAFAAQNSMQQKEAPGSGGHNKKPTSQRALAKAADVSPAAIQQVQQHVATAEEFPALQKPDWKQYHVLEAKDRLEKLPEPERADVVKLIDQPGIPPKEAISIIGNIAEMKPDERREVLRMAASDDMRERDLALTVSAQVPPMPDPRREMLRAIERDLKKVASLFPDDPLTPDIAVLITPVRALISKLDAQYQEGRHAYAVA